MYSFENLRFYRGASARYVVDRPSVLRGRRDRKPKHTSLAFHEIADEWFRKRFGIAYRSQATFVSSRLLTCGTYAASPAHVMRVVPLSEYRYCWSSKMSDLLFAATRYQGADATSIEKYLDDADYKEEGLEEAHAAGHEVMLYCDSYVAIPVGLITPHAAEAVSKIILAEGS